MKILSILVAILMLAGCTAQPSSSGVADISAVETEQPAGQEEAMPVDLSDAELEMLWNERIYHLYWSALNGYTPSGEITPDNILPQDIMDLVLTELVQGGYPEFEDNLEGFMAEKLYKIPFALLDEIAIKLFNRSYDWPTLIEQSWLADSTKEIVEGDYWTVELYYDQYTRRCEIPINSTVAEYPYEHPKARIQTAEAFDDGTLIMHLSEELYENYGEGDFLTTKRDVFTFNKEGDNYYLASINVSYDETDLLSVPQGADAIEEFEPYPSEYFLTTVGDDILSYDYYDNTLFYYLNDAATGETQAQLQIDDLPEIPYNLYHYDIVHDFDVGGDKFLVNFAGHYYELDEGLQAEPRKIFTDDDYDFETRKRLYFSPDRTMYAQYMGDGVTTITNINTGDITTIDSASYNLTTDDIAPQAENLGLATGASFTEMAVDFDYRYVPYKFLDNETVVFAVAGYEHIKDLTLYDMGSGSMTPYITESFGAGNILGFTDYAHVVSGADLHIYVFEEERLVSEYSYSQDGEYFFPPNDYINRSRYCVMLKSNYEPDQPTELYLVDSMNGELIHKGEAPSHPDRTKVSYYPLDDGSIVVDVTLFNEHIRYII